MAPRLRRMYTYRPRRRTRGKEIYKQAIHDIKHRLSTDVNGFLVLWKQGNTTQLVNAKNQVKADFLKHSEEMLHLAEKMGPKYVRAVRNYLDSVDAIVDTSEVELDDAKVNSCFVASEKLDRELLAS